jgi:hypothetical protein
MVDHRPKTRGIGLPENIQKVESVSVRPGDPGAEQMGLVSKQQVEVPPE